MKRNPVIPCLALLFVVLAASVSAQTVSSLLRGSTPLDEEGPAAPMTPMRNTAEKEMRNYPEQPPVIPHSIDGYQIDINGNKCLSCHARARTAESQALMVRITPFHGPRGPVPRLGVAAPLLLHRMPRSTTRGKRSGLERFPRHRFHAEPGGTGWTAMSTADKVEKRPSMLQRIRSFVFELWDVLRRPSSVFGLGMLVLAGFIAGIMFWGAFNTALELTNTEKFCTTCHEMRDNVFAELKSTIHFTNRSGVRASCPDCHVPHNWTDKIARKMQASKEVWGHLFGSIDRREKFVDRRLELALHEWARFKANDSLECRNCHSAESMDITKQSPRAAVAHDRYLFSGEKTCIDCHKGIAHHLPDMRGVPGWQ